MNATTWGLCAFTIFLLLRNLRDARTIQRTQTGDISKQVLAYSLQRTHTTEIWLNLFLILWGPYMYFGTWSLSGGIAQLAIIPALFLSRNTRRTGQEKLQQLLFANNVALIQLADTGGSKLNLWINKSLAAEPPLELEIGIDEWVLPITELPQRILEKIRWILQETKALENPDMQKELKTVLTELGVSHPLDISGSKTIPEIETFFEDTLLTA